MGFRGPDLREELAAAAQVVGLDEAAVEGLYKDADAATLRRGVCIWLVYGRLNAIVQTVSFADIARSLSARRENVRCIATRFREWPGKKGSEPVKDMIARFALAVKGQDFRPLTATEFADVLADLLTPERLAHLETMRARSRRRIGPRTPAARATHP